MTVPRTLTFLLAAMLIPGGGTRAEPLDANEQPRAPHPEPRVIVNVLSVRGPHKPDRVQHAARFGWKRIVRCYKSRGAKERAVVTLELLVSSEGSIKSARSLVVEPKDHELAMCLVSALPGLTMPKAAENSTADVEIQLAPGDRPVRN